MHNIDKPCFDLNVLFVCSLQQKESKDICPMLVYLSQLLTNLLLQIFGSGDDQYYLCLNMCKIHLKDFYILSASKKLGQEIKLKDPLFTAISWVAVLVIVQKPLLLGDYLCVRTMIRRETALYCSQINYNTN